MVGGAGVEWYRSRGGCGGNKERDPVIFLKILFSSTVSAVGVILQTSTLWAALAFYAARGSGSESYASLARNLSLSQSCLHNAYRIRGLPHSLSYGYRVIQVVPNWLGRHVQQYDDLGSI